MDGWAVGDLARRWSPLVLVPAGTVLALWLWAGLSTDAASADVRSSGTNFTVTRDDGRPWRVIAFQPGRSAEIHVGVRRRGPVPLGIIGVPVVTAGPPRDPYCGWWPERALVDGHDLAELDDPYPVGREATATLVLYGRFLGSAGCLDEGRVGGRRSVHVDVSVAGAPKRVRIDLPVVLAWSTTPQASAERLAERPVNPRVGTAP
jgi:hypothetical protein